VVVNALASGAHRPRRRFRQRHEAHPRPLSKGRAVILFPEGTRTRDGQLQPVSLAGVNRREDDAPVVPVRVWGTFEPTDAP